MPSPETTLQPRQNPKTVSQKPPPPPPQEQPQKCPRCNSSNTKFCYYNNYSLAQPRHFCKTCRRYWTRGGALRNVPVGGGSRKPVKKPLKTATMATKSGPGLGLGPDPGQVGMGGPYARLVASGDAGLGPGDGPYFGLGLMGLSGSDHLPQQQHQISITSIESLSCINQEMHFKLQQQRLATIYGTTSLQNYQVTKVYNNNIINNNSNNNTNNNDLSRKMDVGGTSSEWLFDETQGNYGGNNTNNIATSISMGVTTTNISCNDNVISNEVITRSSNNMHGIWGDLLDHNHDNHNTSNDDYQQQQQQRQQIQFDELH